MRTTCRIVDSSSTRHESVDLVTSACGKDYWGDAYEFNYCPMCGGELIEEEVPESIEVAE